MLCCLGSSFPRPTYCQSAYSRGWCLHGVVCFPEHRQLHVTYEVSPKHQAFSEGCESRVPAWVRSSQTNGESTDGLQCLKPTGNEQQNWACILFDDGWVETVCLVAASDFVFQCSHANFEEVQGAIYLVSHTLGKFSIHWVSCSFIAWFYCYWGRIIGISYLKQVKNRCSKQSSSC